MIMKKSLLLLAAAFLSMGTFAQTNLVENGDFEAWEGNVPTNWKTTSSAGNAKISQSTDAHAGQYSVKLASNTKNKRLAYKETSLKAGTYYVSFYAKGGGDVRPGYVPVTEGKVGTYVYGKYNSTTASEWTLVKDTIKLEAATTVCFVVMNPGDNADKNYTSKELLVDDYTVTTTDGGIGQGGDTPEQNLVTYQKATTIESGKAYLLAASYNDTLAIAEPITTKSYGYFYVTSVSPVADEIQLAAGNTFTFTAVDGGYTIQQPDGKYVFMKGTFNSFNVDAAPEEGNVWTVDANADGTFKITNVAKNKYIQYSQQFKSYGSYDSEKGLMPYLYVKKDTSDAIKDIHANANNELNANAPVYNLAGQRVSMNTKGILIQNGKKFVNK